MRQYFKYLEESEGIEELLFEVQQFLFLLFRVDNMDEVLIDLLERVLRVLLWAVEDTVIEEDKELALVSKVE